MGTILQIGLVLLCEMQNCNNKKKIQNAKKGQHKENNVYCTSHHLKETHQQDLR